MYGSLATKAKHIAWRWLASNVHMPLSPLASTNSRVDHQHIILTSNGVMSLWQRL